MHEDSEHDHDHHHDHADAPPHTHPVREDDDVALTRAEAKFLALKSMLIEKGVLTADEVRRRQEVNERGTPHQGARMVAKAWVDPAFKARMLEDGKAAAIELGIAVTEAELMVIENTPQCHNLIVCTLCSCYPLRLLGTPPAWYKTAAYRSRVVRDPRSVLAEFGLHVPAERDIAVWDSTSHVRYMVLPRRPSGTEALGEEELARLVRRDALIGVAEVPPPG
jgi:nitrile hydratase